MSLIEVDGLTVHFASQGRTVHAVEDVSFSVGRGETLGIVGESGSGKSVTALALMRLVPTPPGKIISGRVLFEGRDLMQMSAAEIRAIRGRDIAMVFQDPMTSLNPVLTVGRQLTEVLETHLGLDPRQARTRAIDLLSLVGIPSPERRIDDHPHKFSGGMRQRVLIAMALIGKPDLLIADEPTTALDVSVQAQVLKLMTALAREDATAVLFITHNLGVVAKICSHVAVMYAGNIVETGAVKVVFKAPQHPYTCALMAAVPKPGVKRGGLEGLAGVVPNLQTPPPGCRFAPRCHLAVAECTAALPSLRSVEAGHGVACIMAKPSS